MKKGITQPKIITEGVIKQIETYLYQYVLKENKKYRYIRMGEIREFNLEIKSEEK